MKIAILSYNIGQNEATIRSLLKMNSAFNIQLMLKIKSLPPLIPITPNNLDEFFILSHHLLSNWSWLTSHHITCKMKSNMLNEIFCTSWENARHDMLKLYSCKARTARVIRVSASQIRMWLCRLRKKMTFYARERRVQVTQWDSNPWPLRCRCSAPTNWATKSHSWEQVNLLGSCFPVKGM